MNGETGRPHRAGRFLGGLIFAVGLGMLIAVFVLAAAAFAQVPAALGSSGRSSGQGLAVALGVTAARVGFLVVMAYASSLVASKGLELLEAARGRGGE